jgi:hypothetical protein
LSGEYTARTSMIVPAVTVSNELKKKEGEAL